MGNAASGRGAYEIKLKPEDRIGGGIYADVYRIRKYDNQQYYAAKFFKYPYYSSPEIPNINQ